MAQTQRQKWRHGKKEDDAKKPAAPTKEDRYLGDVQGNILDNFQNPTYNLKLYMIPAEASGGGGWLYGASAAKPEETVVIAQTGVTGVQIDNLDISFVQGPGTGNSTAVRAAFTLKQPGAADLLDQIQVAKMQLGHYMYADVPLFLEVNFQGYKDDIDDNNAEGEPTHIAGPYIYQLKIAKVSIAIDHYGSDYEFECPIGNAEAYNDFYYKIPKDMSVQGADLEEMSKSLEDGIKKFREDNLLEEEIHDETVIDLSDIKAKLDSTSLLDGSNRGNRGNAEQVNRLINAQSQGIKTKEDYEKALEDNPDSLDGGVTVESGGGLIFNDKQQINMVEGTSMNQFFTTMLVMCDDFLEGTSRKKLFRDYSVTEDGFDLNQTFQRWYRIRADVEYIGFDTRRMKYAKRITYKPVIYETRNENQNVAAAEHNLDGEQITKIVRDLHIKKAYHYLYTGLNDQVLDASIQYNAGQVLLAAPGGGKLGDMSTNPNSNTPNKDKNEDLSGKDDAAKRAATQSEQVDAFKKSISKDENFQKRLQADLRMSDDEFKDFKKDKERVNDTAKAMAFTNYQQGGGSALRPSGNQSSGGSGTGSEDGTIDTNYQPEASGFIYSADLIDDLGGTEIIIGEMSDYVQKQRGLNSVRNAAAGVSTEPRTSFVYGPSVVSTSGDTSDGTNAATLFGYMYQNVNDASILVELGLSVRGDPWYLGPPTSRQEAMQPTKPKEAAEEYKEAETKKNEGGIVYTGADNFFLFTMQTPRVRDPNYDDEDENSGYMKRAGTAFFISGIYRIVSVTCSFGGGEFKVEFEKAPKETSLALSKFDLTAVDYGGKGTRQDELDDIERQQNAEAEAAINDYINAQGGND